jgi:hypothetical protein
MSPEEFSDTAAYLCGRRWKKVVESNLEVKISTVNRWANGYTPISRETELALQKLLADVVELRNQVRLIVCKRLGEKMTTDDIRRRLSDIPIKGDQYLNELIEEVRRGFVEDMDFLQERGALKDGIAPLFRNEILNTRWNN